jgi:cytochrome P450
VTGDGVTSDPFKIFRQVGDERIFFSPLQGGFWVLTRAADIRTAMHRPEVFSNSITGIPAQPARPEKLIPLELDPPDHTAYRRVLAPMFAPKAIAAKAAAIRQTCIDLIEPVAARGECEFIADIAQPFPSTVFAGMLGLPIGEAARFIEWNNVLLHAYDDPERRRNAAVEINGYLRELVAERAADPRDDLISALLAGNVGDRPVTREEVHNFAFLLFVAGLDTVTAALSFTFRFLAENPTYRRQLIDNPEVVTGAAEELLRVHSFVNTARTVVADVEIFGVGMKAGDRVLASTTMAAMDADEYPDPLAVRFDRPLNRNVAFGAGPHRCAGAHLAREELCAALEEFHRRIPDYRVVPGATIRTHGGGSMGMDQLPLTWEV